MKLRVLRYTLVASVVFGLTFLLKAALPSVTTGSWVTAGNLAAARSGACTAVLTDGRLLISGGADASGPAATADLFNTTGTWSAAANMNSARGHQVCASLPDGRVLVAGGTTSGGGITNAAEIYDPNSNAWSPAGLMNDARSGATASVLQDGRVLIAGGQNSAGPLNTVEIFDPNSGSFSNAGVMSSPRQDHAAALLQDGRVLIVGGSSDGANALATTDIYDPPSGTLSSGPAMLGARTKATATTLLDGTVIVIGGSDGSNDLASSEFFDPQANNFNSSGSMSTARSRHSAFLLPKNNQLLVVGGQSAGTDLASAELYTPWQKSFQSTGAMAAARSDATGAALTAIDGRLLIAGGSATAAELYGFATVKTDAADYPPGTTVNILGSGWQPGEQVALTLVESPLLDTHGPYIVTADAFGNIRDSSFTTDDHDLNISFELTARGSQSQAQNRFTDSKPNTVTLTPASVTVKSGNSAVYTVTVNFNGNGNSCTSPLSVSTPLPTGAIASFSPSSLTSTGGNVNSTLTISTTASTPAGTTNFTVLAGNGAGCQAGTATSPGTLIVDNTPPSVTINQAAGQADPTKNSPINFTVVFSESVADFATGDVSLTGTAGATTATVTGSGTTYDVTVSGMAGSGTVVASIAAGAAHDAAGNANTASTSTDNTVTYDIDAPPAPSTPDMTAATDSGSLDTDNITNIKKPTFTGSETENGALITLLVDGVANGTTTAAGGSWTITAANNIADGDHTVTATATDSVGNVSLPSGSLSITIDTVANAPSIPDLDPASDSGSHNDDNITNVTKPKFNGTAEKNATVELFRGGTISLGTTTADNSGNWSLTLSTALADNTYSITATQTDVAGNVSAASSALSITIDTAVPAAPSSPNLAASSDSGTLNNDNLTNQTTNLLFSGNAEANATITIFEGATQVGSGTTNNGGNWNNVTAAGPFGDGPHTFTAKATDAAGNTSNESAPHIVTIDTVRPSLTINQAASQADPTPAGPIHFTVVFSEAISGFATGDISLSGTAGATTATVSPVNSTTFDVSVTGMTQGGTVIAAVNQNVATDTAGNGNTASTSTDNTVTYNPDNKPPVVTITFSAVDGANGWYVHSPVLGTVTANDATTGNSNVSAITCTDGASSLPVGSLSGIGTPAASGSVSVSGEGSHSISCTATDSASNSGAFTGSTAMPVAIKIDTVAPALTATRLTAANGNGWNNTNVSVHFACTDSTSLVASIGATGAATGSATTSPLDVTVTTEGAAQSVSGSCKDNAGNDAVPASVTNINIDKTKPVITGHRNPAPNANGWNMTDVTVSFTCADLGSGVDSDTVAGATVSTEGAGQSVTNTGSCLDKAGNAADSATVSDINIDKTAPSVSGAPSRAADHNSWYNHALNITWSGSDSLSGIDTCDSPSAYSGPDSASASASGHCTDKAGNQGTGSFNFMYDGTAPAVNVTPGRAPDHNGWYNHPVTFTPNGSDATSGIDTCDAAVNYTGPDTASGSVAFHCHDQAGNDGSNSATFMFDATAPTNVTGAPNRVPDHNGWYNQAVDIVFTGQDATSGIANCTTVNYSGPDTATATASGHCTDNAGNPSTPDAASAAFKFDSTPPSAALAVSTGTAGTNGWYISNVTVSTTGADNVSNPVVCTADQFQTAETTGAAFSGSCTNDAGLAANAAQLTVKLDKTPPSAVTLTASGTLGLNNWYTSDVSIQTSGTETISTPIVCTAAQSQTTDTTGQTFSGRCTNDAGLASADSQITIKRDATPPVLSVSFTPDSPDGNNGWWRTPGGVPFSWTCTDATSGVDSAYNGGCPTPLSGTVVANGTTSFSGQVRDQAGNLSVMVNRSLKLDNVAPTIALVSRTPANGNGWNRTDVALSWSCADSTSLPVSLSDSKTVTTEGLNQSATGNCQDNAGNTSSNTQTGINIDKTPPTVTAGTPPSGSPYLLNQVVNASFTCSDNLSGFVSSNSTSATGRNTTDCTGPATVDTSTVGAHSYGPMIATDKAGNTSIGVTVNYNVNYNFVGFFAPIDNIPVLNSIKGGQTVPIKWQLKDANGNPVSDLNSLAVNGLVSGPIACSSADLVLPVEETLQSPGSTVFRFDGTQFIYNWQTLKGYTGGCRLLQVTLADGTQHYAKFQFK
jgi:hypothetical protein